MYTFRSTVPSSPCICWWSRWNGLAVLIRLSPLELNNQLKVDFHPKNIHPIPVPLSPFILHLLELGHLQMQRLLALIIIWGIIPLSPEEKNAVIFTILLAKWTTKFSLIFFSVTHYCSYYNCSCVCSEKDDAFIRGEKVRWKTTRSEINPTDPFCLNFSVFVSKVNQVIYSVTQKFGAFEMQCGLFNRVEM